MFSSISVSFGFKWALMPVSAERKKEEVKLISLLVTVKC
jgi:hypothetical protein